MRRPGAPPRLDRVCAPVVGGQAGGDGRRDSRKRLGRSQFGCGVTAQQYFQSAHRLLVRRGRLLQASLRRLEIGLHQKDTTYQQRTVQPDWTNPNFWDAGANFLAPIYVGGALQAQVRIQTAQQEAATLAFGQAALSAFSDVETSLSNEGLLADRDKYLQASVRDNSEAYRLGRIQFEVGATDLLSVLQLQGRLLSARAVLIGVEQERLTNRINLHLALGGISIDRIEDPFIPGPEGAPRRELLHDRALRVRLAHESDLD